jgi:Endonuclease/Exonuclease/phosphatase family
MGTIAMGWWNLRKIYSTPTTTPSPKTLSSKANGWTEDVYAAKRANLAAVLNELHGGDGPELLGVAEVEGDDVFAQLLAGTGNPHLKLVTDPSPSPDLRGIDVSIAMTTASSAWSTRPPTSSTCAIPPGTSSR